jgi:hypothetical protein
MNQSEMWSFLLRHLSVEEQDEIRTAIPHVLVPLQSVRVTHAMREFEELKELSRYLERLYEELTILPRSAPPPTGASGP